MQILKEKRTKSFDQ